MLTLLVLISAAVMAQTTVDFTKLTWSSPLVQSPYTFSADKNSGSTAPTQNTNSKDIRLYANNSLTISTSSGKICKIVFHISTNGLKQWADFTPNNGSVTVSKEKRTATWENAEGVTSVTFTVGAKCKYGTAATTKAGQFFFNSVDITELDAATPPQPLPPLVPTPARHSHSPMARLRVLPRLKLPLQRATTTPTCLILLNIQALTRTS